MFTSAFGAYLQALNWRTIGNQENAKTSMIWFWGTLLMVGAAMIAGLFPNSDTIILGISIGCLVGWYSQEGKKQVQYVKQNFGTNYPKKPWGKVLLLACACLFAQLFLTILLHGVVHGLD
ncbi:MAG: hypothetical protein Q4A28_08135 [Brachymonas sp.]|nr:hypothetical protein [Brachymonas sp.]